MRICGCYVVYDIGLVREVRTCPFCMVLARMNIKQYIDSESSVSALVEVEDSSVQN